MIKSDSIKRAFALYQSGQFDSASIMAERVVASGEDGGRALLLQGMIAQ